MRILSLHIDNFGKLRDLDLDLTDGVNCIEAENGYGKTTLAAFIKAMLFGLPQTGKRDVTENERKHYLPWQGGICGGTLDIETEKGRYRVSRTFSKKAADDTFSLVELDTKLPSGDYTEKLGIEIFGLDAESYEKSVYIPQRDVDISMTSTIGAKLNELLADSGDMADLDSAVARLEEYSKRFKLYRGDGGLIKETNDKLARAMSDIENCRRAEADAEEAHAALAYVNSEAERADAEIAELNKNVEAARLAKIKYSEYETYKTYLSDVRRAEERLARYTAALGGNIPTEDEIKEMSRLTAKIAEASADTEEFSSESAALSRMSERFGDVPPTESELDAFSEKNKRLKDTEAKLSALPTAIEPEKPQIKNTKSLKLAFYAALAVVAVGVGLSFVSLIAGIAVAMIGAVAAVVTLILDKNAKSRNEAAEREYFADLAAYRENEEKRKSLRAESDNLTGELERALGRYYPGCPGGFDAVLGRIYPDAENYARLLEAEQLRAKREKTKIIETAELCDDADELFGKYNTDTSDGYAEALRKMTDNVRALENERENIAERRRIAEEYAKEKGLSDEPPALPDVSGEEARIDALKARGGELKRQSGALEKQIELFESRAEALPELIEKADALRVLIADYEEKRDTSEKAKEYLKRAADRLSSRYLRDMEKSFGERYSSVTGEGRAPDIDAELGVSFREGGSARDPKWYSEGIRSIMYICMRLSLVDALFGNEKPFLILDDPFSELDAVKFENAASLIRKLGEERQIVYFTCHASRRI